MIGIAEFRSSSFRAPRRRAVSRLPRAVSVCAAGAITIWREVARHAGQTADVAAVHVLRLAVLGAIVWGGSNMVRSVTGALQAVAGHSGGAGLQTGATR